MSEFVVTTDRNGSRTFSEHDDRWGSSRGGRGGGGGKYRGRGGSRGSYKGKSYYGGGGFNSYTKRGRGGPTYTPRGRGRGGQSGPDPRSRLDDEGDLIMEGDDDQQTSHKRFSPYGRPSRGSSRGRGRYDNQSSRSSDRGGYRGASAGSLHRLGLPLDTSGRDTADQWHKIIIPWGKKAGKDYILKMLTSQSDTPFVPTYFHFEDNKAVFYVQDRQASDSIRRLSGRITMPNGYKMKLLVRDNAPPPVIPMGDEEKDKLKIVMSGRYDPASKTLNLNNLYQDKDLQQQQLYLALSRPQVMSNVLKIIEDNIPELVSLNISDNRLTSLELLSGLVAKTPNITELNLGKNRLSQIDELKKLSGWKLTTVVLDGNTLCDKFKDQTSYISAIRKIFPKVLKLDGHELPPPITFDIEARTDLPKSKGSFFPNKDIQTGIIQFLKDYIGVYDSANRQPLMGAYHEDAVFSLSMSYNGSIQFKQPSLQPYLEESRNLARQSNKDTGRKQKLRQGNLIVPQLCLLPRTTHDPNSFVVDVNHASSALLSFTLSGVFREGDSPSDRGPLRAFSRTMVTVPRGQSMAITNDMLTITNASQDQIQTAFKHPAPTPSSSPVPEQAPGNPFEGTGLTQVQQQMVVSFMADSGMNSEWSIKCLQENNWEYEKAGKIFMELRSQQKIPAEAFIK